MTGLLALALLGTVALGSDPVATLPMTEWNNLVIVPVSVETSSPFRLMLDTGMSLPGILLSKGPRVDALDLDFTEGPSVAGAGGDGGPLATRHAHVSSITLGGLTISDVAVSILPDGQTMPADIEGVIGFELFQRYAVHVDRDRAVVALYESATLEPASGSTTIPLVLRNGYPFVELMVAVSAKEAEEASKAELIVDLGAVYALWLNTDSQGRFAPPAAAIETSLGFGAGGRVEGHVGRSRLVRIGDLRLENVVTLFPALHHQPPSRLDMRDGFIGADVLSRLDVTIDYPGKRLILRPSRVDTPFEWDMSGLLLNPGGDGGVVESISAGSPAEQAGLLAGDVLVAVDGKPIAELLGRGLRQLLRRDGAEVRLTIKRGDETLEKRLTLRRLI